MKASTAPSFLLTREELQALAGAKLRRHVVAWLLSKGWAHEIGLDDWPRVSRTYAEAKLAGIAHTKPASGAANTPNFQALQRAG
jgi:hypothetical protein